MELINRAGWSTLVGLVGLPIKIKIRLQQVSGQVQPETGSGRQDQPLRPMAGRNERRLGFGELGMDDQRLFGRKARASRVKASAPPAVGST